MKDDETSWRADEASPASELLDLPLIADPPVDYFL
jgi:hypothetical protein